MGNDVGDINNDGLLDVVVLDMLPDEQKILKQSGGEDDNELFEIKLEYGYYYQFVRNTLQLNLGGGMFSEIGRLAGIYATDWSWSPLFCDVDNDGWKDLFITNVLPTMAQFSPVRDIYVHDFNLDGRPDLVLVGNNYSVRPSVGRYDASYGWCLLGTGHGFKTLTQVESCLRIDGDARRILPIEIMGKHMLVAAVNDGKFCD